jgi:hypothetical protein
MWAGHASGLPIDWTEEMVEKRYQSLDAAINEAMKTGEGALLMFKGLKRGEEFMTINGHGDISKRGEGRISHDTAPYHMIQGHIRPHKVLQAILVHTPRVSVDSLFPTKPEEKASLLVRVRLQCERVAQDDPGSLRGRVRAQPANVLLRCQGTSGISLTAAFRRFGGPRCRIQGRASSLPTGDPGKGGISVIS